MKNKYEICDDKVKIFLNKRDGTILHSIIDIDDLERAKSFPLTWYSWLNKDIGTYYCAGNFVKDDGKRTMIFLHRWLLDCPDEMYVDHRNHDTLDNTRVNLCVTTPSENSHNRLKANKNSKTGIRGVTWNKGLQKYQAHISVNRKLKNLGYFDSIEEASKILEEYRKEKVKYVTTL